LKRAGDKLMKDKKAIIKTAYKDLKKTPTKKISSRKYNSAVTTGLKKWEGAKAANTKLV